MPGGAGPGGAGFPRASAGANALLLCCGENTLSLSPNPRTGQAGVDRRCAGHGQRHARQGGEVVSFEVRGVRCVCVCACEERTSCRSDDFPSAPAPPPAPRALSLSFALSTSTVASLPARPPLSSAFPTPPSLPRPPKPRHGPIRQQPGPLRLRRAAGLAAGGGQGRQGWVRRGRRTCRCGRGRARLLPRARALPAGRQAAVHGHGLPGRPV